MGITDIEVIGEEREQILQRLKNLAESWGLTIPDVTPYPLHFGYNDFYRVGETEFDVNNNIEEGYCGKFIFVLKGQTCPMHYHRVKHETFYLVKGMVEMESNNETVVMHQGDIKIMPQNTKHRFTGLENSLILECSKPDLAEDSIFDDERINELIAR
ncbi:MAG TPA: cupin domain-containing protein [Spirochaetes bacterium]|nr:cupin domain-containing protein [Spirochaetota bacterium]